MSLEMIPSLSPHRLLLALGALSLAGGGCLSSDALQRRTYEAHYQQAVQLCGHPDAAFQDGYNAGYAGDRMRSDWTAMCVAPARAEAFTAYQTGFLQGANNAPIKIVHAIAPIRGRLTTGPAVSQCTFSSDCGGEGYTCRDNTCMGYGSGGERCVFNADCLSDHCFAGACRE
jgi:hypothetical protein